MLFRSCYFFRRVFIINRLKWKANIVSPWQRPVFFALFLDNSVEHREETANRALGIAYTPILVSILISSTILIAFFGFGTSNMSSAYITAFVGGIIGLGLISALIVPLCNLLFRWFSKIKIERKPRKSKKNNKPVRKSAEPEEAIFIGIND